MTHFVLVLFAGDYRDASRRRAAGESDRYRHHSYALACLDRVRATGVDVTVIQMHSDVAYDEVHGAGVRFVGLGPGSSTRAASLIVDYLHRESATHVMVRFPSADVLEEILTAPVRVAVVLADSFPSRWRQRRRYRHLRRVLADPKVDFVGNHHLASSRQLAGVLHVDPRRIVPWDWPLDLLDVASARGGRAPRPGDVRLCYVGTVSRIKGVWDLVDAVSLLRARGVPATLDLAGSGDVEELSSRVAGHALQDHVRFLGRIGGDEILSLMQRSDLVCVPSRHSYPEGLPLTIYEAMASGTPLVASDHPMFRGVVRDGVTGFVFRAGSSRRLASTIQQAVRDEGKYALVSSSAAAAYAELGLPALWGDLVERWVRGGEEDHEWFARNALASYVG